MNIRRFVAGDMRKVLREVRSALGPDAVILSTKSIDDGVEVIAAIDYDDTLISRWAEDSPRSDAPPASADAGGSRHEERVVQADSSPAATYASIAAAAAGPASADDERVVISARSAPTAASHAAAASPAVSPAAGTSPAAPPDAARKRRQDSELSPQLAAELSDLRELLEHQLSSLAWNDTNRRHPVYARTLRQFAKLGLDPQVAKRLAGRLPRQQAGGSPWRAPLQAVAARLPLAKHDLVDLRGAYAIIGPTGVGKTTTIAKIAARFVLRHGVDQLGLVTTDGFRIGARDQLMTFARILGTPMHVANDAKSMRSVLAGLGGKRLILIDTAGMSQRDARLAQQFAALRNSGGSLKTVLALSAAGDLGCLRDALQVFRAAAPVGLIATKIDEAVSLGPILSLLLEARLPLAYLCDGQRVPEDLHLAGHRRAWLIRMAMQLAKETPRGAAEEDLAAAYGGYGRAANG